MIEIEEGFIPRLNVNEDRVIGVFGNDVHIMTEDCIVITEKEHYLQVWQQWLAGKQAYCEANNEYCGVFGETHAITFARIADKIINTFDEEMFEVDENNCFKEVIHPVFIVSKFDDYCDFEHG